MAYTPYGDISSLPWETQLRILMSMGMSPEDAQRVINPEGEPSPGPEVPSGGGPDTLMDVQGTNENQERLDAYYAKQEELMGLQAEWIAWQMERAQMIAGWIDNIMARYKLKPHRRQEMKMRIHKLVEEGISNRQVAGQRELAKGERAIAGAYEKRGLQRAGAPVGATEDMYSQFAQAIAEERGGQKEKEQSLFRDWNKERKQSLLQKASLASAGLNPAQMNISGELSGMTQNYMQMIRDLEARNAKDGGGIMGSIVGKLIAAALGMINPVVGIAGAGMMEGANTGGNIVNDYYYTG